MDFSAIYRRCLTDPVIITCRICSPGLNQHWSQSKIGFRDSESALLYSYRLNMCVQARHRDRSLPALASVLHMIPPHCHDVCGLPELVSRTRNLICTICND